MELEQDWVRAMRRRNLSPDTIKRRRNTLRRFREDVDPLIACERDVTAWLDRFVGSRKPATVAAYLGDVRAFYRWALRQGLVDHDPTALIDRPRVDESLPRPIADGDLAVALDLAPPKIRMALAFGALGGLRRAEVARLSWADLDRNAGILWVAGKGGKPRVVPVCVDLDRELGRYGVDRHGPVIPSRYGTHYKPESLGKLVNGYLHDCGIRDTVHTLRHWAGTGMVNGGADIRVVAEVLGHSNLNTTRRYTRVGTRLMADATERLRLPSTTPTLF